MVLRRLAFLILLSFTFFAFSAERFFPTSGGGIDERGFLNNALSNPPITPTPTQTPTPTLTPTPTPVPYDPSTFYTGGTLAYWIPYANNANVQDVTGTPSADNTVVKRLLDQATSAYAVSVVTGGPRYFNVGQGTTPGVFWVNTSVLKPLLELGITKNQTKISWGAVISATSGSASAIFTNQISPGTVAEPRFQPQLFSGQVWVGARRTDADTSAYINTTQTVPANSVSAVLVQWDVGAGTISIYLNNANTSVNGASYLTAGTTSNTNASANSTIGHDSAGGNFWTYDEFIEVGSLMDSTQRTAWFAAAKAKFGITAY